MGLSCLAWVLVTLVYVRHSMNIKVLCFCGHDKSVHPNSINRFLVCDDCIKIFNNYGDSCSMYTADNLRYLEALSEQSSRR